MFNVVYICINKMKTISISETENLTTIKNKQFKNGIHENN